MPSWIWTILSTSKTVGNVASRRPRSVAAMPSCQGSQTNGGSLGAEGGVSRIAQSRWWVGIGMVRRFRSVRTPWLSAA